MRLTSSAPVSPFYQDMDVNASDDLELRLQLLPSFFDEKLPPELLRLIMQSLSHRPAHFYAHSYVDPADFHAFCASSEAARCVLRQFVSGISTGLESENCEGAPFDPATRDPGLLLNKDSDADIQLLEPLLRQLATAVKSLTVDASIVRGVAWLDAMVHHATDIRDLSLINVKASFPLTEVLRAAPNLQALSISSDRFGSDRIILQANHVFTLRHEAKNLESLSLSPIHADNRLGTIWNDFPKLSNISLCTTQLPAITAPEFPDDDIFGGIASGASPVDIHTLNFGELKLNALKSLTALCGRVGSHLKSLSFSLDWSIATNHVVEHLSLVKEQCPNVGVRVTCFPLVFVAVMEVLGDRLEAVQPTRSIFVDCPAGIGHAARCATKLKSITLTLCDSFAAEFLDNLLRHIGSNLHELRLTVYPEFEATENVPGDSEIVDIIAKYCGGNVDNGTGGLKRLVLDRIRPAVSLKKLAQRNLLAIVVILDNNIQNGNDSKAVEDWMAQIVEDFLYNCPNIVDISIEENKAGTISPRRRIRAIDEVAEKFWGSNRNRNCDNAKRKIGVQVGQMYYEK